MERMTTGPDWVELPAAGPASIPPLVFLHEGLGCVEMWRGFPARLHAALGEPRAVVYSRPGYGQAPLQPRPRGIDYLRDQARRALPELLSTHGITAPVLVGHSDGASIAIDYAGSGRPASALVLLAPHLFAEACTLDGVWAAVRRFEEGDLLARMARYHRDPELTFRGWSDMWLDPQTPDWSIVDVLPGIRVPVLAIQGTADQYGTAAQLAALEASCEGPVEVHQLPGVGHAPHLEAPGRTVAIIESWLRSHHLVSDVGE